MHRASFLAFKQETGAVHLSLLSTLERDALHHPRPEPGVYYAAGWCIQEVACSK